jgi:cell division protein ZapA
MSTIDVSIMGVPYKLACREGEEDALREAVAYVDAKMCGIRDAGKVKGNDRIAVMTALGIAAEMLSIKAASGPFAELTLSEVKQRIAALNSVIDAALLPQENLF